MSDYKSNTKIKFSSEKSFGILFSLVFLLLFIISIIYYDNINFIFLTSSIVLLSFSFIYPKIFKYPNNAWINLGLLLGKVVSPIVMIIIYLCVFFLLELVQDYYELIYLIEIFRKIKTHIGK